MLTLMGVNVGIINHYSKVYVPNDTPLVEHTEERSKPKPQANAIFYLAATMWGEARGEGAKGMSWVGHVVKNRATQNVQGNNVVSVALSPKQFSCWNKHDPNHTKLNVQYLEHTQGKDRAQWETAKILAQHIYYSNTDPTHGAIAYHEKHHKPYWRSDYQQVAVIGQHVFYR